MQYLRIAKILLGRKWPNPIPQVTFSYAEGLLKPTCPIPPSPPQYCLGKISPPTPLYFIERVFIQNLFYDSSLCWKRVLLPAGLWHSLGHFLSLLKSSYVPSPSVVLTAHEWRKRFL